MEKIKISYKKFMQSGRYARFTSLLATTKLSPKQVFDMTIQALDLSIGGMEPEVKYKTEHLFEPDVWADMGDAVSRCIGICLSYLTANDLVPLAYANRPNSPNKLYKLKHGVNPEDYSFIVC